MPQEAPGAARVHVECLDQASRTMVRGVAPTLPAVAILVWILGDSVPLQNRLAWATATCLANVLNFVAGWTYGRRRAAGEVIERWPLGIAAAVLEALAWSSAAIIALPSDDHVELRAIYALFVCAVSSTNLVGAAALRSYFYAFQIPLMGVVALAFAFDGDQTTRLIGFAVPIYFTTIAMLYHEVNQKFVSEISLKYHNEDLLTSVSAANAQLTDLVMRDALTGLANRTALTDLLEGAVARSRRDRSMIGVLYFDLDRFKNVNDSLGHHAGDALLVEVAARVKGCLRAHDVFARLGGDEFVVLVDRLGDSYEAYLVAERIRRLFTDPFDVRGRRVYVTTSIGVATNLHARDGATELLSHADAAQYRAKESGRNRVEVFDIDFRTALARRIEDERAVIEALAAGEIVPYFQPQVDLRTGRVVGAEALARWEHPDRGVLGAPHFIPLAEETGLIAQIDERIIMQSVRARLTLDELGAPPEFRIWCNVSPRQFARVAPVERLARFLEQSGCDARGLGIEITETAVLTDMDSAALELANARRRGIAIALDDFGTGHSSLTMLQHLPIDEVKIDQSFVRDLGVDATDTAIVRHVAALAADLGVRVVAEGVQSLTQATMLANFGCNRAQGFLWSPAVPLAELAAMVERSGEPAAVGQPSALP